MNQKWAAIDFNCLGAEVEKKTHKQERDFKIALYPWTVFSCLTFSTIQVQAQFGTLVNN